MKFISKNAIKIILLILLAVTFFHFFILFKFIPYDIAWGGWLKSDMEMYVFEILSIIINLFLCFVLLMKGNFVKQKFSEKWLRIILWAFMILFVLNTIGNVFAKTNLEKTFALITFVLATLIVVVLKTKNADKN